MNELRISPTLSLPLDVTAMASAIFGIRGSGKTNTGVVLVEEALKAGQRCAVLDPLDVWWGLKSSADGARAGFDVVIFGGAHQDLPLHHEHGRVLARLIAENPVTAVFSLRHLRKHHQVRFAAEFLEELYHLKGDPRYRERLFVAIDEASAFVPQTFTRGASGDGERDYTARCVGAVEDTIRRGRNAGFGVCLIDQRPASVNKNALSQCELLILHRVVSPQDRDALREYSRAHDDGGKSADLFDSLGLLGQGIDTLGEAWVWSPFLNVFDRVRIRRRDTFDSSATPKAGEMSALPATVSRVEVDEVRAMLAGAIEEAEANDPKAMRKEIADLRARLAAANPMPSPEDLESAFYAGVVHTLRQVDFRLEQLRADVGNWLASGGHAMPEGIAEALDRHAQHSEDNAPPVERATRPEKRVQKVNADLATPSDSHLPSGATDILGAIAFFESIGQPSPTIVHVGAYLERSPNSGHFRKLLNSLREAGLATLDTGRLRLTDGGRSVAPAPQRRTVAELHEAWISRQEGLAGQLLRIVLREHPRPVSLAALGAELDKSPNSGYFRTHVSALRRQGLVELRNHSLQATDFLFPEGLR